MPHPQIPTGRYAANMDAEQATFTFKNFRMEKTLTVRGNEVTIADGNPDPKTNAAREKKATHIQSPAVATLLGDAIQTVLGNKELLKNLGALSQDILDYAPDGFDPSETQWLQAKAKDLQLIR